MLDSKPWETDDVGEDSVQTLTLFPFKAEGTTEYWHTVLSMQKGLVSGLAAETSIEVWAQRSGEKQSPKKGLMSQWLCYAKEGVHRHSRCHRDVRKVEPPLDIKDVIDQTSYFSKTIVMDITPPSIHWLDIPNSIFCSLSLYRTCLLLAVNCMAEPGE